MVVLPWTLNSRVNMIYIYNLLVYLVCIAGAADVSIEQTGCLSDTACNCNTNVNLTCTLTPFQFGMLWKVDSTTVFQCSSTACFVYNDNYTYYHDLSAGTFTISLIPITMAFDQIEFRCNGDGSDTATYHPNVVVRLENGDYSSEREDLGNIYRVNISTKRCVFPSDSFTFAWKASTSSVLEHDSMTLNDNTKTHVACPFDPNANCGSNGTINITDSIEIEKDVAGKLHYLFVKVTQNNHIETIQLPGQFWLKTNKSTFEDSTTTDTLSSATSGQAITSSTSTDTSSVILSTTRNSIKSSAPLLNEPVLYLIVGGSLVFLACVISVCYIIYRRRQ